MKWEKKPHDIELEEFLIKSGKGKLLSRLLSQRDILPQDVEKFILSEYKDLNHPFLLNDCEKASKLFCQTIKNKGKIAVIGDYDVDGIVSSVMIRELCNSFGSNCYSFLPSRLDHGYGLSKLTVEAFFTSCKEIPELLFVVDCGTNSKDEIQQILDKGVKHVIVIDHHLPTESIATNASALISWHLSTECKEMCACGEIFQFIRGIRWLTKKVDPLEFLSYAAIGTIADVSNIVGDNRIIVKNGLTDYALNHIVASGMKALIRQSKIYSKTLTQHDVSFKIAPKINAVGRIYTPNVVFDLLIERDPDRAKNAAEHINKYNEKRKGMQKNIELEAIIAAKEQKNDGGILVVNDSWHVGIVGIVASKIVETFNKPSIVIGKVGEKWKGSGRSVKGVNLKEILDTCPEIFDTYGGHAGAVGVTLKPEFISSAHKIFDLACKKYYLKHNISKDVVKYYDAMLDVPLIMPDTSIMLKSNLYPYCTEHNAEPTFMIPRVTIMDAKIYEGEGWKILSFFIERNGKKCPYQFKYFTKGYGTEIEGKIADIVFTFPQHDNFESTRFSQFELMVTDIITK